MNQPLLDIGGEQRTTENDVVNLIKRKRGRPWNASDILTHEELELISSCPDKRTAQGIRDYAILLIFCNTPIRLGELITLKTSHLVNNGDSKFIAYVSLKKKTLKKSWRIIPITQDVYDGVKRYLDMDPHRTADTPMFFTLGKHGPYEKRGITKDAVDGIVAKYVAQAGLKKRITPHSFRASFVTLRKNEDWKALQEMGGWTDMNSMMPYVRASAEEKRKTALAFSVS